MISVRVSTYIDLIGPSAPFDFYSRFPRVLYRLLVPQHDNDLSDIRACRAKPLRIQTIHHHGKYASIRFVSISL